MDRGNDKFVSPFFRPDAAHLIAASPAEPETISALTFLPKSKALKGIVAGECKVKFV